MTRKNESLRNTRTTATGTEARHLKRSFKCTKKRGNKGERHGRKKKCIIVFDVREEKKSLGFRERELWKEYGKRYIKKYK